MDICQRFQLGIIIGLIAGMAEPVAAQIVPDNTLPNNSTVTRNGKSFTINGGTTAGGSLFHSFGEFSLPTGGTAFFNNAVDIENIITRVTGGKISEIDGIIRANGAANLLLINPSGLVFGPNARLNLGGSFLGSTADSIQLSDGSFFSATTPNAPPLLTISVPTGLQWNQQTWAAPLRVIGSGDASSGLAVAPGHTLALVGGDVVLENATMIAPSGRVELGSIQSGQVRLDNLPVGWTLGYNDVRSFGTATFSSTTVSNPHQESNPSGGIQITGGNISILDGSQIVAHNFGSAGGGNITLNAKESLAISGNSAVVNRVELGASGAGGEIAVSAPQISLRDRGKIQTITRDSGAAGNLAINADTINIDGTDAVVPPNLNLTDLENNPNSRISSESFAAGRGGEININSRELTLTDGGQVLSLVGENATGAGGKITVDASDIFATGVNPAYPFGSSITSLSLGAGAGGDIDISSQSLTLNDGGGIQSVTTGTGSGGNIAINATEAVTSRGINPFDIYLGMGITTHTLGSGNGGDIAVSAPRLQLESGSLVASFTFPHPSAAESLVGESEGNAGDITILATESVEAIGSQTNPTFPNDVYRSRIMSDTHSDGNAGDITISTPQLRLFYGANVASFTAVNTISWLGEELLSSGTGNGGNITVNASQSIEIVGTEPTFFFGTYISSFTVAPGDAGNTIVNTSRLNIRDGGQINSTTSSSGNAGEVIINASDSIFISGTKPTGTPSDISSSGFKLDEELLELFSLPADFSGNAGRLTVNTGRLTVTNGARVGVQHDGTGDGGTFELNAKQVLVENGGRLTASTASGSGGNAILNVRDLLELRHGGQIAVTAFGSVGNGGNLTINTDVIVALENSDITANAVVGSGGNIAINAQGIFGTEFRPQQTPLSDITASSQLGISGNVSINNPDVNPSAGLIELSAKLVDAAKQFVSSCATDKVGSFIVVGRGGLPPNPRGTIRTETVWRDFQDYTADGNPGRISRSVESRQEPLTPLNQSSTMIEATGWVIGANGEVELVNQSQPKYPWYREPQCQDLSAH